MDNLVNKEDHHQVVTQVTQEDLDRDLHKIKMISIGCSNSNRMIQEELHNKEAHQVNIPTREVLHQDIQMHKEDHHKEIQEDLLKEAHQARPETCSARND